MPEGNSEDTTEVSSVAVNHRGSLFVTQDDGSVAKYWYPDVDEVKEAYADGEIDDDELDDLLESALNDEQVLLDEYSISSNE
ncbi:hypothetical protein Htur_5047 (plasmid) [Haloterrigena turkmenica DSM 5511]|uniref:Uncharacterized protein n=1 Tax=Haloterrigena turkmenica (strain ATCC 51198 / DSM 5511 / JCM 9101 / NCIMB 13204 / VKM B-1734 / 4k) TaxID=543526 RepID=D2S3I7_HALTV|nr:hypothetical protein [Haloterrigena turkmenica]ADB63934.1 hypothetical protein Htur_5047 [Haloterrigena turkmenica DSM 5511]